jgi:tetratricopeptide (TPR) repeat protein
MIRVCLHPLACSAALLAVGVFMTACAGPGVQAQPAAPAPQGTTMHLPTTYVTPTDAGTIQARFDAATAMLRDAKFKDAAAAFDNIVRLEPRGALAAAAAFNAGFALEQAEDRKAALERYRDVIKSFPAGAEARSALIRATRILAWTEDWKQLVQYADMLLARGDLSPIEQVEAHGARALGLVEQGDVDGAATSVSKARTVIEEQGWGGAAQPPVAAAQVFFALGEIRRARGERIVFSPMPPNFSDVLEQRCQMLLDAQDAYAEAMRAHDPHWAAMAGYRVGQLYQQLHRDVMAIAPPPTAKTDRQRQLFEGAMQLRYRVLLEKGLKMMDKTLEMAVATGESSLWVHRARDAKRDLEQALIAAKEALAKLPYAEADLQRALDGLAARKSDATSPGP